MIMKNRVIALSLTLLAGALLLSACGVPSAIRQAQSAPTTIHMPDFVLNASPEIQIAYQYAVEHPQALETVPCYCGCSRMGHRNNLDCYIKPTSTASSSNTPGEIVFDNHAAFCGVCIDITLDVMRMSGEGKTAKEIRAYIDSTYSSFGPSTDTKVPAE